MLLRIAAAALAALAVIVAPAAAAPGVRTAVPADDGAHPGAGTRTEWWFVNATDPATGLSVAAALGSRFPNAPAASVVFLYPPGGGTASTVAAPRIVLGRPATARADVRLGTDRLWSPRPGELRVRVTMSPGIVLSGPGPADVRLDLTMRAATGGFLAGPLTLPRGQDLWWTVAAPSARVSGTVTAGDRTWRLRDAPGYHDHNFGDFDLGDPSHGGWDWSQVHLPGGRSLVTGVVRPVGAPRDGVSVLSGPDGRLGVARASAVEVTRGDWASVDGHVHPRAITVRARLSGGWEARVRYTARRALPLLFSRDGDSALVEIEATTAGTLLRDGRPVARWSDAPGFCEYESTPVTRERDAVPGSVSHAARLAVAVARELRAA